MSLASAVSVVWPLQEERPECRADANPLEQKEGKESISGTNAVPPDFHDKTIM